jgi:hypothetical protein
MGWRDLDSTSMIKGIFDYLAKRIKTLPKHCVICDSKHPGIHPRWRPVPCEKDECRLLAGCTISVPDISKGLEQLQLQSGMRRLYMAPKVSMFELYLFLTKDPPYRDNHGRWSHILGASRHESNPAQSRQIQLQCISGMPADRQLICKSTYAYAIWVTGC